MLPRMTPEEIKAELITLDMRAAWYRHPDGQLSREEFIEQASARLQLQLQVVAGLIGLGRWEEAAKGVTPMPGWLHSLAAACVGMMPHGEVVDLVRRQQEIAEQRPLRVVSDDGGFLVLGPDDHVPDSYVEPPAP